MRQKNLILLMGLIFVSTPILILSFDSLPMLGLPSADKRPTASMVLEPSSPVGSGVVTVQLITSEKVIQVPAPLVFVESDTSVTRIWLEGRVPGNSFVGTLNVDESIAEGVGCFCLLAQDALVNERGGTGQAITLGKYLRIDKTPPSRPTELRGVFHAELLK